MKPFNALRDRHAMLAPSVAKDKIKRFIAGEMATLADKYMVIYQRWNRADQLQQQHEPLREIVRKLQEEFRISSILAHKDVFDAQEVFSNARAIDKLYIVYNAWQRAEETRKRIADEMEARNMYRDPKMLAALAEWEKICLGYINSFPVKELAKAAPKLTVNFVLPEGEKPITVDAEFSELLKKADGYLHNFNELPTITEDNGDSEPDGDE